MSKILENLRYSKDHEWVRIEGDMAYIGITDHAQHELGEIVFVELPPLVRNIARVKRYPPLRASRLHRPS